MSPVDQFIERLFARLEGDPTTPEVAVGDIRQAVSDSRFCSTMVTGVVTAEGINDLHV